MVKQNIKAKNGWLELTDEHNHYILCAEVNISTATFGSTAFHLYNDNICLVFFWNMNSMVCDFFYTHFFVCDV